MIQSQPGVLTELEQSFAKVERTIMESIAASDDRVVVHQALKHLVVAGNALIFMNKDQLKMYPLNRYVVCRDGNGNVTEIVTKEKVAKKLIEKFLPKYLQEKEQRVGDDKSSDSYTEEVEIFTHVKRQGTKVIWYQEVYDKIIPTSYGKAPLDQNPWLPLRFNTVDGEAYGRGRCEEFLGDLVSQSTL